MMQLPSAMDWPDGVPQTLRPYSVKERMTIAEAAIEAGVSQRTARGWCLSYELGRKVKGKWAVSRVAWSAFLDGNEEALNRYLCGDRTSPCVVAYFTRHAIPILPALATSNVHPFLMRGRVTR